MAFIPVHNIMKTADKYKIQNISKNYNKIRVVGIGMCCGRAAPPLRMHLHAVQNSGGKSAAAKDTR